MSDSREESPDWLRSFQAPAHSTPTISSDSESLPNSSPSREENDDCKEPFLHESSQSPKRNDNHDKIHDHSGEESTFDEKLRANSSKRPLTIDQNHVPPKKKKIDNQSEKGGDGDDKQVADEVESKKHVESHATDPVWALSSDSDDSLDNNLSREQKTPQSSDRGKLNDAILIDEFQESPSKKALKKKSRKKSPKKSPKKEKIVNTNEETKGIDDEVKIAGEGLTEKHIEPPVSTSGVPLILSDKVNRSKALVECEGESIDLSGDMGAVGRIIIPDTPSGNSEMYLDLKGTIYRTTVVPSRTFCVVSFGPTEAKIESIMNDFIQLKPQSNVYEAETMVEGTLDGFSFDSEDEAEKMPKSISHEPDQNDGIEEQANGKNKRKKRGKTTGGKPQPPKKVKKKASAPKKTKTKK